MVKAIGIILCEMAAVKKESQECSIVTCNGICWLNVTHGNTLCSIDYNL